MADFEFSHAESGVAIVTSDGTRLPDERAKFVRLSLHNVTDDDAQIYLGGLDYTSGQEVYYGFGGVFAHQLFPTQTTDLIPVKNLSDIHIKTRAGCITNVWYSFYR